MTTSCPYQFLQLTHAAVAQFLGMGSELPLAVSQQHVCIGSSTSIWPCQPKVGLAPDSGLSGPSTRILKEDQLRLCPQHIADLFEPRAKGIVEQVGVTLRGLDLRVAEELSDHRQRHAARNEQRREGMAQIVDADAGQFRLSRTSSQNRLMS